MPNYTGGKNFKKGKKKRNDFQEKKLIKRSNEDSQEYGQVVNAKGNGRFVIKCCDGGKERLGIICGKMRKRVWINRGDLVLICKWDDMSDDTKCSIIHKYSEDDAKKLQHENELPENLKLNIDDLDDLDETGVDYHYNTMPSDSSESDEEVDLDEI